MTVYMLLRQLYNFHSIDAFDLCKAFVVTLLLYMCLLVGAQVYAAGVTLSVVVQTSLTFTTTNNGFSSASTNITPGSVLFGTTTLSVVTNDNNGWNVTLSGDNKSTGNNNLQTAGNAYSIPDQTEWVAGTATTSAGNAVRQSAFVNSQNVLAYRVMSASSTNGAPFFASAWWGTADNYVDSANTLWAGISSSTASRQIGNAGLGSYSATAHLNTVLYYLLVASTQPTGTYTAPITYTATGN